MPFLHERSSARSTGGRSFFLGDALSPFLVRTASTDEAPVAAHCTAYLRRFDLRSYEGELYRPTMMADLGPATLAELENAGPTDLGGDRTVVDNPAEAAEWHDHPGYFDRIRRPAEDPYRRAVFQSKPRGGGSVHADSIHRKQVEIQGVLDRCLIVGDMLWRPTAAPGKAIVVKSRHLVINDWLPGFPYPTSEPAVFFDMHEEDAKEDLIERLSAKSHGFLKRKIVENVFEYRGRRDWIGHHANAAMVRSAVRCLAGLGHPNVASLGAPVAAAFWRLADFPPNGSDEQAARLLDQVETALTGSDDTSVASVGATIEFRRRSLAATA